MVVGEEPAPPLAGSWFDLLDEQEAYAISPQYEKHRLYWRERLAERPAPAMLSPIPPTWAEGEIMRSGSVAMPVTDRLRALGERHGAGLPLVIIAATAIYLHRMTGSRDISIGIPVTARLGARTRNIVGRVSNILPLRLQIDSFMRLDEVLKRASARLFEMTFHQRYRSEDLRLDLGIGSYAPEIFGLTVNVRPFQEALRFGESLAYGHIIYHGAPHGLSLYVSGPTAASGGMDIDLDANPALYAEDEVRDHHRRFLVLLEQLASAPPDTPVHQLDLLEPGERKKILETFNTNDRALSDAFVHELFEARVAANPEGTALVFGDFHLCYGALNEQANRLAFALLQSGVGPGGFVGIALERSEKMVIAVLAVLKAGGAIVPLGVDNAPACLAELMSATTPEVVLSDATGRRAMPAGTPVIDLDTFANSVSASALFLHNPVDRDRPRRLLAQHPAYVCIDGASGIGVTHASLSNAMAWIGSTRTSALLGVVCQWQTLDRIGSLHEILHALTSGMTLEIVGEGTRLEPRELAGFLAERTITDWFVPFRLLEQVVAAALKSGQELPSLRDVFQTGGEPIFTRSVQGFFEAHPR
jgi:nonribosomal peptide synthetase DhbF